jgi:hypothetical protein
LEFMNALWMLLVDNGWNLSQINAQSHLGLQRVQYKEVMGVQKYYSSNLQVVTLCAILEVLCPNFANGSSKFDWKPIYCQIHNHKRLKIWFDEYLFENSHEHS